ncbi:MAG: MFS transporter, partial [Actinobacteria bacterium]|nr:MFS transporter [Actinomycetota bacterium]
MAGNGLQGSLIGIRSEAEGFSATVAGFVMAAYFGGFLAGSRYSEYMLARVGHIRVFAGLASMASSAVLIHALFINPLTWGAMRFVTGMCMAGLYVVAESWLNDLATNKTRGRLLSIYMVVTMGGMTAGQFL